MKELHQEYDKLQLKYGSKDLNSVYGYGCDDSPNVALVFMNPTKRNIATNKSWRGIKAQWLGTKQIWDFLCKCGLFDDDLNNKIKMMKPKDWSIDFCKEVYECVSNNSMWITNLAKCSQDDARELEDEIFLDYKDLLYKELDMIRPKKILLFGNQVSSIVLNQKITVSTSRMKKYDLKIGNTSYETYAIFYPVGNGRFNQDKAIEDINKILS